MPAPPAHVADLLDELTCITAILARRNGGKIFLMTTDESPVTSPEFAVFR